MRILQVASEMTPIAKVGGLGDVLMGLTRELSWKGHDALAVLPFYGMIDGEHLVSEGRTDWFDTLFDGVRQRAYVRYFRLHKDISVALLDTESGFFRSRRTIYGNDDEVASFLFFCRAVVDWLLATNRHIDILHVHDWPTALLPAMYPIIAQRSLPCRSVLTVHNFEYQGRCHWGEIPRVGIHSHDLPDPSMLNDPVYQCANLVKAGLLTVDAATTVSPTYAREMVTEEHGQGLHGVLTRLGKKFVGILNGIDYAYWNPKIDPYLFKRYGLSDGMESVASAKLESKARLFSQIGIPLRPDTPLIASVARLVRQKGISLMHDLFAQAEELNFQCLVLGSVPEPEAQHTFSDLDRKLRACGRGAVFLMSDEAFAHRTYAATDLFFAPSLFEPCGLTQLISLKYGVIPVVRRTGGLADTIVDVQQDEPTSNGFLFDIPDLEHCTAAVYRALALYQQKEGWRALMQRGMQQDFSWNAPGNQYISLYQSLL